MGPSNILPDLHIMITNLTYVQLKQLETHNVTEVRLEMTVQIYQIYYRGGGKY